MGTSKKDKTDSARDEERTGSKKRRRDSGYEEKESNSTCDSLPLPPSLSFSLSTSTILSFKLSEGLYRNEECAHMFRRIKAWEVQFLNQKYGVTKLLVSEKCFEILNGPRSLLFYITHTIHRGTVVATSGAHHLQDMHSFQRSMADK